MVHPNTENGLRGTHPLRIRILDFFGLASGGVDTGLPKSFSISACRNAGDFTFTPDHTTFLSFPKIDTFIFVSSLPQPKDSVAFPSKSAIPHRSGRGLFGF